MGNGKHLMMEMYRGQWALVTGASSGIGQEFCQQLSQAGVNIVLVARREAKLRSLSDQICKAYNVQCCVIPVDLSLAGAAVEVKSRTTRHGITVRLLVNNAGTGHWGRFEAVAAERYEELIQVNTAAMVSLCERFFSDLASFDSSAIINVSSPAALQPIPYMAVYAATKAFVHSFSQALYGEWKDHGISVQTLVPGPTATEFDAKAGAYGNALTNKRESAEIVVKNALAHLNGQSPLAVSAKGTYKQRLFCGLFPARVVIRKVGEMFEPPDKRKR